MTCLKRFRYLGLIAALPLANLLAGCGASHARYTPTTDEAQNFSRSGVDRLA